jgi:Ca2+-transporting ATPase
MVTGDYPVTAAAIGREIGLDAENVLTGAEVDQMDDTELERAIRRVNIFARILPEQKLRLVKAFKAGREIVAMTGDGVNDAPALRMAHIGIAMGQRGTDVAREASSLVLLDDNFTSIVHAIRQGRRVFDNLRKVIAYILAIHIPTIGMTVVPLFLGMPMVFFPVHIAFLEFVIDPTCSIAFEAEPEERNVMQRPPRNPREPLLKGRFLALSVLQGLCAWLIVFAIYAYSLHSGYGEGQVRAMAFATLAVTIVGMIFSNRSLSSTTLEIFFLPNKALWYVTSITFLVLVLVLYFPAAQEVFRFSPIGIKELLYCLITAWLAALSCEGLKRLYLRFTENP